MGKPLYTAAQFIEAIPGTGGIISTIADRVGCTWNTAKKYIDEHATIRAAYDDEAERIVDLAESVLVKNIQNAAKMVKQGGIVDTGDVKWYLSRKGKSRGYVERQEVTGADSGPLTIRVEYADIDFDAAEATHGTAAGDP